MTNKKTIILVITLVTCASVCLAAAQSPSGSATPCAATGTIQEPPFIIYFEAGKESPDITKMIMNDFPDAIVELTGVANNDVTCFVAYVYVPKIQRKEFLSYLTESETGFTMDLELEKVKIISDKKDPDYINVQGDN